MEIIEKIRRASFVPGMALKVTCSEATGFRHPKPGTFSASHCDHAVQW
ncbi:hypothetical protein ACE4RV_10890 [Acetobacter persici]